MGGSSRDAPSFLFGLGLDLPTDSGAWLFLHVAAVLLSPDGTLNRPGFGGGSQSRKDESHGGTEEVQRRAA